MELQKLLSLLFMLTVCCVYISDTAYASWAYPFVVNNGKTYAATETHIEPSQIGKKIGEVTKYSDLEGSYSRNFSNEYQKGTEYYQIKGVSTKEAIAIKDGKNSFVKAEYKGEYAGSDGNADSGEGLLPYYIGGAILIIAIIVYLEFKRRKRK
jgi:hypothetical protein